MSRHWKLTFLIIPWSNGRVTEVQLSGKNSILYFPVERQINVKSICQPGVNFFSLQTVRSIFNSHSLNIYLVNQTFDLAV
jgi:hypothetical protein